MHFFSSGGAAQPKRANGFNFLKDILQIQSLSSTADVKLLKCLIVVLYCDQCDY